MGGDLASILDTISETIAERVRMRREVLALTAQGRASGWVLAAIPIGLFIILYMMSPSYLSPLLDTDIGRMCIVGAFILEVIGFFVIQRIVNINI